MRSVFGIQKKVGMGMEFVIMSGLSGAGKSKAAAVMEDMGFFCVDNLPVKLIGKFAELAMAGGGEYSRVALVTDVRGGRQFEGLFQVLEELREMQCPYSILFMEADNATVVKRYKESRRSHPLLDEADSLEEAIALERRALEHLRDQATHIIDTSNLSLGKLRGELMDLYDRGKKQSEEMEVRITSFGFKYGLPMDADLVFDVRFLPNPYYVPTLRPLTGLDEGVRNYVFSDHQGEKFLSLLQELLDWLFPRYVEEGKTNLVLAVGCTGGKHRSVAIAHAISQHLRSSGERVAESHRDMGRV